MEEFALRDWVNWRFSPRDPNGPYAYMLSQWGDELEDPIEDYTNRYQPGPYLVGRVIPYKDKDLPSGYVPVHPQIVGIWMYPKGDPVHNPKGQLVKLRHFSGYLFQKVDPPENIK